MVSQTGIKTKHTNWHLLETKLQDQFRSLSLVKAKTMDTMLTLQMAAKYTMSVSLNKRDTFHSFVMKD